VPVSGTPGSAGASRRTPPVRAIQTDRDLQEHPEPERGAWLKLSEDALTQTWDNSDDGVFNELLAK
jgi:hypothetical protein